MNDMSFPLLSHRFRLVGIVLCILGIGLGVMRFVLGIKPAVLTVKVFAVYALFFETRHFEVIQNNLTDEAAGILLFVGLALWAVSRERHETDEVRNARCKALFAALTVDAALLLFAMASVFGLGFAAVLAGHLFSLPILYIGFYYWFLFRQRRRQER